MILIFDLRSMKIRNLDLSHFQLTYLIDLVCKLLQFVPATLLVNTGLRII